MKAKIAGALALMGTVPMALLASSAWARELPATGTLHVESVSSSAGRSPAAPPGKKVFPLRVRDPQQYAQQKAAANRAYRKYADSHRLSASGQPGSSAFSRLAAVSIELNQPGLNASEG